MSIPWSLIVNAGPRSFGHPTESELNRALAPFQDDVGDRSQQRTTAPKFQIFGGEEYWEEPHDSAYELLKERKAADRKAVKERAQRDFSYYKITNSKIEESQLSGYVRECLAENERRYRREMERLLAEEKKRQFRKDQETKVSCESKLILPFRPRQPSLQAPLNNQEENGFGQPSI